MLCHDPLDWLMMDGFGSLLARFRGVSEKAKKQAEAEEEEEEKKEGRGLLRKRKGGQSLCLACWECGGG